MFIEHERLIMESEEHCRDGLTMDADTGSDFFGQGPAFFEQPMGSGRLNVRGGLAARGLPRGEFPP
jgi:hypothetical protein